jgi:hypothetical protein
VIPGKNAAPTGNNSPRLTRTERGRRTGVASATGRQRRALLVKQNARTPALPPCGSTTASANRLRLAHQPGGHAFAPAGADGIEDTRRRRPASHGCRLGEQSLYLAVGDGGIDIVATGRLPAGSGCATRRVNLRHEISTRRRRGVLGREPGGKREHVRVIVRQGMQQAVGVRFREVGIQRPPMTISRVRTERRGMTRLLEQPPQALRAAIARQKGSSRTSG